ncbi:hypothetical protein MUN89_03200 [Halobacillus salinarum]|uniref:Lipoprotein n=1 Tax=Halobacillus salinarum TaxID=2932257 RepID=A0ABY4EMY6_9BACI|nr:hypothetical protein [Halobacillus salinarum]UOQ44972.1 hypothetical protein MUN89_03200 [Halobacillus salinarum]
MKKILPVLILALFLTACQRPAPGGSSSTVIDWVDFVKWDGVEYHRVNDRVLSSTDMLGDKVGEVNFKVDENVTNPSYQTKNGDAAFLHKGTNLYQVKGNPSWIAVKDPNEVNDYRLYQASGDEEKNDFKKIEETEIDRIEVYHGQQPPIKVTTHSDPGSIQKYINLLKKGEPDPGFTPDRTDENKDPEYYELVFYSKENGAYKQSVRFDGKTWFWHQGETETLPKEIEPLFSKA